MKIHTITIAALTLLTAGCIPVQDATATFSGSITIDDIKLNLTKESTNGGGVESARASMLINTQPPFNIEAKRISIITLFDKQDPTKGTTFIKLVEHNFFPYDNHSPSELLAQNYIKYSGETRVHYKSYTDFSIKFEAPKTQEKSPIIQGCYESGRKWRWQQIIPYCPK